MQYSFLFLFSIVIRLLITVTNVTPSHALTQYGDHASIYPKNVPKPQGYCKRQLDLVLLVDESSSITNDEWRKLIPFLKSLIRSLNISTNNVHLSLVTYSTGIRTFATFLDESSRNEYLALKNIDTLANSKPEHGWTYTGQALNFIREVIFRVGGRKNVPKAIILVTDGASTRANITSQMSAMLRDEGVTILVVGVGNARISECKGIAGCRLKDKCPAVVQTNWDTMIGVVGGLINEVCETIPVDAVCKPYWSEWSNCSVKCGSGTKARKLLQLVTIVEATVGTSGKSGKSCKEQFANHEEPKEECHVQCNPVINGELENLKSETGNDNGAVIAEDRNVDPIPDTEPKNTTETNNSGGGGDIDAPIIGPLDEDINDDHGEGDSDDGNIAGSSGTTSDKHSAISNEDKDDAHVEDLRDRNDEKNQESDIKTPLDVNDYDIEDDDDDDDIITEPNVGKEPELLVDIPSTDEINAANSVTHEPPKDDSSGHSRYTKHESNVRETKSTKRETSNKMGAKIAGGVLVTLLLLGAGGGYAYHNRKQKVQDDDSMDETFGEVTVRLPAKEGETYTVTEIDDGLWGQAS